MDPETLEPTKTEERAHRAKNLIVVLMVILIVLPFVLYFTFGSHVAPTQ
jgi:hypothetical protein